VALAFSLSDVTKYKKTLSFQIAFAGIIDKYLVSTLLKGVFMQVRKHSILVDAAGRGDLKR
jgi:hypothetical protein